MTREAEKSASFVSWNCLETKEFGTYKVAH
jgi:hypothetical protein